MTAPRIIIPHGLAADVLRVLQGGPTRLALFKDRAFTAEGLALIKIERAGFVERIDDPIPDLASEVEAWCESLGALWRLLPVPVRDEPAEVSGEAGHG